MEATIQFLKRLIPKELFERLQPRYHLYLSFISAVIYRFPSRKIRVIGITGTKGKSTVAELVNVILEEAGYKTALQSTVRFKIGDKETRNLFKMTMPGRFFLQRFLRRAVSKKCDYAIIEMTSEGSKQSRHRFLNLDTLIFTNLAPEHIESHGSYEAYREAKLDIARQLNLSRKKNKVLVVNSDDKEADHFIKTNPDISRLYKLDDAKPFTERKDGMNFTWKGETVRSILLGEFNIYNMLAASTFAEATRISDSVIKSALEKFAGVKGRLEEITPTKVDSPFRLFVDYAHTPDSLEAVYRTFESSKKVCVLGSTGGGRDTWKRQVMGEIADHYCSEIILTNEDPYDENPQEIVEEIKSGVKEKEVKVIIDRKEAIRESIRSAKKLSDKAIFFSKDQSGKNVVILITGKGTDPYIMGPNGSREIWSDAEVAKEVLDEELSS